MKKEKQFRKLFNRPLPPKKIRQLGLRLTEEEMEMLSTICKKNKLSKSLVVREVIGDFLQTQSNKL